MYGIVVGVKSKGLLPNLVIIGAPKCGTTSLHYYLGMHPEVCMSHPKELDFFIEDRQWRRGTEWYAAHFREDRLIRGEASPLYSNRYLHPGVPGRMHAVLPDARLIYMVRDPIERMVSQYVHCICDGLESRPARESLFPLRPENPYVGFSLYASQLELFLEHYNRSRILVLSQEELLRDRRRVLREVFRFLGIESSFESPAFAEIRNSSREKRRKGAVGVMLKNIAERRLGWLLPEKLRAWAGRLYGAFNDRVEPPILSAGEREEAAACFRPEVARLRTLTGREFAEWSV